jgi:hypothetical protein
MKAPIESDASISTSPNSTKTAAQLAAEAAYTTAANAVQNAKTPTQAQINALKDAATAKTIATPALPNYSQVVPQAKVETAAAIAEANQAITDVNTAGQAVGALSQSMGGPAFSPVGTPVKINNAFDAVDASLKSLLNTYNLQNVGTDIAKIRADYPEISSADMLNLLKYDARYNANWNKRFAGNVTRQAAGLQPLDPGDYLKSEAQYSKILTSYGISSLATPDKFAQLIGSDVSADELTSRVSLAFDRVKNADPSVMQALNQFYPQLGQGDIVAAVLDPKEQLPALQRKVQTAEIGGAALAQGLKDATGNINIAMGASALADLGVTQAKAREGFQQVAELTPRGNMLSDISTTGQRYGQLQAEQEAFQGLASAKRARLALTAEEQARFQASSGNIKGAPPHTFSESGAY